MTNPVTLRYMMRPDVLAVYAIEKMSFNHPWTVGDFIRCGRERNYISVVAEIADEVIGYMIYDVHKHRFDLLNFAVHPDVRRCGIGMMMIDKIKDRLSKDHVTECCWRSAKQTSAVSYFFGRWDSGPLRLFATVSKMVVMRI